MPDARGLDVDAGGVEGILDRRQRAVDEVEELPFCHARLVSWNFGISGAPCLLVCRAARF
jgi:hypothetical protein